MIHFCLILPSSSWSDKLVSGSPSDSAAVSSSSSSSSSVSSPRVAPSGSEPRALSAAWSLSLLAIAPAGPEPGRPSAPGVLPLTAPRPGPAGSLGFAAGGRASPVPLNRRRQEVAPEHLGPGLRFSSSRLVCQPPRPLPAPGLGRCRRAFWATSSHHPRGAGSGCPRESKGRRAPAPPRSCRAGSAGFRFPAGLFEGPLIPTKITTPY